MKSTLLNANVHILLLKNNASLVEKKELRKATQDLDKEKKIMDLFGYSYLYILSAIPLFIGLIVVTILYLNSLK